MVSQTGMAVNNRVPVMHASGHGDLMARRSAHKEGEEHQESQSTG